MTTTDPLTEQIAAALDEAREDLCGFNARDMAAAVLPIVKAAQAEAWDKGQRIGVIAINPHCHPNPYREEPQP